MAHNLTHTNGKYEFAYTGQSPWHRLGQALPAEATKDDIIKAAGLEWIVTPEPIFLADGTPITSHVANRRSDTKAVLGVVSTEYRLVQNGEGFEFVDQLAASAGAKYHTAGSIRHGRQVFATAKLPSSIMVVPGDVVDQYLLLVNSHDGSSAFHLRWTTVRVVCNNTLTAALRGNSNYQYTVNHRGNLASQLTEARRALGVAERFFAVAGHTYRALAAKYISVMELDSFVSDFLPLPKVTISDITNPNPDVDADDTSKERTLKARDAVRTLFDHGTGQNIPGVAGTAWAAYNAATEYIDRVRTARKDGTMRRGAEDAAVLGIGQDLRNRAMKSAMALVG
jgi:phage/plasmid-like protein (TIGR03299 family)